MFIREVACGKYHTLFLTENGDGRRRELWACGANNFGQIGNNSNQNQFLLVHLLVKPQGIQNEQASRIW